MNDPNAEEPKLIIDEDWKSQVEREREQLRQVQEAGATTAKADEPSAAKSSAVKSSAVKSSAVKSSAVQSSAVQSSAVQSSAVQSSPAQSPGGSRSASEPASPEDDLPPAPPASFPLLVSMLGTQALMAMGQLGHDPAAPPRLDYAKHYIDLLGVLEEKTKNNLSSDEAHLLGDWLHQLRLAYVEATKRKKYF